ncbi:MAG: hypothetical protein E7222_12925 [Clostridiales bacterium]|nr:hypothetical protein [Clostridiales bacterium]
MKRKQVITGAMIVLLAFVTVHSVKAEGGIAIDEAHFPDENFRAYVMENCDYDEDGMLSREEIGESKILLCCNCDIRSIVGIEYFTELEELECSNNELGNLDVSKNAELKELGCRKTKLTNLDVSKNVKLKNLSCNDNKIKSLDLSKNTELRRLECGFNKLTNLDVSKNVKLENLSCNDNKIKNLDLSKNTELRQLGCGFNKLTNLDASMCSKLRNLICDNNKIKELNLSGNSKMEAMACAYNKLRKLDLPKDKVSVITVPTSGFECLEGNNKGKNLIITVATGRERLEVKYLLSDVGIPYAKVIVRKK